VPKQRNRHDPARLVRWAGVGGCETRYAAVGTFAAFAGFLSPNALLEKHIFFLTKNSMITLATARKVLEIVDAGLCHGLGKPKPGAMCVEAAVCYALGQPHGDEPTCVSGPVRAFKIRLNDSEWSNIAARAAGMRRVAVAQLGSAGTVDSLRFARLMVEGATRKFAPFALRAAAKVRPDHAEVLESAARRCESEGGMDAVVEAKRFAYAANADHADDFAADAAYAAYAANAYAYAAYAANANAAYFSAADAYAHADDFAADAASLAADSARFANYGAAAPPDAILIVAADLCEDALRECGSPGVALLDKLLGPRKNS